MTLVSSTRISKLSLLLLAGVLLTMGMFSSVEASSEASMDDGEEGRDDPRVAACVAKGFHPRSLPATCGDICWRIREAAGDSAGKDCAECCEEGKLQRGEDYASKLHGKLTMTGDDLRSRPGVQDFYHHRMNKFDKKTLRISIQDVRDVPSRIEFRNQDDVLLETRIVSAWGGEDIEDFIRSRLPYQG